jgi:DnaJ-class molecular chaperone
MPLMSDPDQFGDMLIEFDVEYPQALHTEQKEYIKAALIQHQNNKKQQHPNNQNRKKPMNTEE